MNVLRIPGLRALACAVGLTAVASGVSGQNGAGARVQASVEYIAGANIYLTGGTGIGIVAGDTLDAATASRSGRLRVISSGERKSVVTFAGDPFPITIGDSLTLTLPMASRPGTTERPDSVETVLRPDERRPPPAIAARAPAGQRRSSAPARPPVRIDGTFGIEFDALQSDARWGDLPEEHDERRFMTPGVRLNTTVTQLPGGLELQANVRYEQRLARGVGYDSRSAVHVYTATVSRAFQAVPLQIRIGRFHNLADLYGGYWDGGLVRLGGRHAGIGVSAGYTPDRVNGGFSTVSPKSSVFADLDVGGRGASYRASIAVHQEEDTTAYGLHYVSGTQQLRLGRAIFTNRVRFDAGSGWSDWSVAQMDVSASTPLVGNLRIRGNYARRSYTWAGFDPDTARPHNERRGAGIEYAGYSASASVDARIVDWSDGESARTVSTSLIVQQTPLAGIGFGINASRSESEAGNATWLSPSLFRRFGPVSSTLTWQDYRTDGSTDADSRAAQFTLSFPLAGGFYSTLRLQARRGSGSSSNRLFTSLWKSF